MTPRQFLTLSKVIPARMKTVKATWCKRDFQEMTQAYRKARHGTRINMNKCFWCGHEYEDGEMMALAHFLKLGNRTLCQKCASELTGSEGREA